MLARYKSIAGLIVLMFWVSAVHTQTDWTENENNPVLDFGTSGEWDAGVVFLPTVIQVGDTLKMWYSGAAQSQIFGNPEIGYAWSLDGVNWNRHPNNPVLPKRSGSDSPKVDIGVMPLPGGVVSYPGIQTAARIDSPPVLAAVVELAIVVLPG